jgi:hypothetical protein
LAKHQQIIDFRNNVAAHSGDGDWDDGKLAKLTSYKDGKPSVIYWSELKLLQFFDDRDEDLSYVNLLKKVISLVEPKFKECRELMLKNKI